MTDLGVSGGGCTLASPLLTFPNIIITNGAPKGPGYARVWITLGDNQAWDFNDFPKAAAPSPHFPYGFAVQPDVPL